jgi:lysozyme family protein
MTAENFDECLKLVRKDEGGYSNHPSDPGGATQWGIAPYGL